MISQILDTSIRHRRAAPKEHSFGYRTFMLSLNLEELEAHTLDGPLLRYNRGWGVYSIRSADYLTVGDGSIREKLEAWLLTHNAALTPSRITLVTMPRYFGYVFNPVSFYLIENSACELSALICEVNNTFGEKHIYLLEPSMESPGEYHFPKTFYVSPFIAVSGEYTARLVRSDRRLEIAITLERDGKFVFSAILAGNARSLSQRALFWNMCRYPVSGFLTMLRIHLQAFILIFLRSASVFQRPAPLNSCTIRSEQSILHKLRLRFLDLIRLLRHDTNSAQ